MGGNLHPRLDNGERSIANKYREGKLKSTSKGELKDLKSLRRKRVAVTQAIFCHFPREQSLLLGVNLCGSGVLGLKSKLCYLTSLRVLMNFFSTLSEDYQLAVRCQKRHVYTTRLETRTKELN
jgi:hypothetical protein